MYQQKSSHSTGTLLCSKSSKMMLFDVQKLMNTQLPSPRNERSPLTSLCQNFQTLLSSLHLVIYFFLFLALKFFFLNSSFSFLIALFQLKHHHFCIVCYTLVFKGFACKIKYDKYNPDALICEERLFDTVLPLGGGKQHQQTKPEQPMPYLYCTEELQ